MDTRRHPHERDRLTSLRSYGVLDAGPDAALEGLTRLAATVCGAPTSMITLVDADRHWFLSRHGLEAPQLARSELVCSDVVAAEAAVVVSDLTKVERYAALQMVRGPLRFRAYAGVPLIGRDGLPLGALCVLDTVVRQFGAEQLRALDDLARHVINTLELRRHDITNGLTAATLIPEATQPRTLRRALDAHEFIPHFQPLVDMRTGAVTGLEALVRWQHPTRGVLTPDAFLAGLETGSLVGWIGRDVLEAACALLQKLQSRGVVLPDGVAVNVTGRQLTTPGLAAELLFILSHNGLPGSVLTVEITETAEVSDFTVARAELKLLREAGVRVVADDFGVGWSNLTRLLQLPLSGLKIDKSLVTLMVGEPIRDHMVASAITLAAAMGLDVIAEGVETEAVRERLLKLGCHRGQGWLFSRAMPADGVEVLLAQAVQQSQPLWPPSVTSAGRSANAAVVLDADVDVGSAADQAEVRAGLDRELVDLECRRYTDRRGLAARAEQLMVVARTHGLSAQAGRLQLVLADEASRTNDVQAAVDAARSVLLQARARGESTVAARCEAIIAWCLDRMGAMGDAVAHAVEAVRLLPPDAPAHLRVDHRLILALFNAVQTRDDSYVGVFDGVLADAEQLANPHLLLSVLNNYAWTLFRHDNATAALPLLDRLQVVAAAAKIPLNSTMLDTIAAVLLDTGDLDGAEAAARIMVDPETLEAEVRATPDALLTLSRIARRRGAHDEALAHVLRAETVAAQRGLPELTAVATMAKSTLLAEAGDTDGAYRALSVSYTTWVQVRDRDAEARAASLQALFETEQVRQRSAIFEDLADRDALTGLWNRRHLDRLLPGLLTDSQITGIPLSVAIVDVDHFKWINDERSHASGDAVLAHLGEVLSRLIPEPGFTARLGGEEFLLAMPGSDSLAAVALCERTRQLIRQQPWDPITGGLPITVSIGCATSTPVATVSSLLSDADAALYSAKHAGRDQVRPVLNSRRRHR